MLKIYFVTSLNHINDSIKSLNLFSGIIKISELLTSVATIDFYIGKDTKNEQSQHSQDRIQ